MLACRLCWKVFGFVKTNLSGAQWRQSAAKVKKRAGEGRQPLSTASTLKRPERAAL